jgi:hypothetical protein
LALFPFINIKELANLKGNVGSRLLQYGALIDTGDLLDRIGIHEFLPANTPLR